MTYKEFMRRLVTVIMFVILAIGIALAVWNLSSILLITFTCWVVSVGMNALIRRITHLHVPRSLAIALAVLLVTFLMLVITALVLPPFLQQVTNLVESVPQVAEAAVRSYNEIRVQLPEETQETLPPFTMDDYNRLLSLENVSGAGGAIATLDFNRLLDSALPVLLGIGSFFGNLIATSTIASIITLYLIIDPSSYYRALVALVPSQHEARAIDIINKIRHMIIGWIGTRAISTALTGGLVTLTLGGIFGIPNSVALGVIAALAGFVPTIGYYFGAIPILMFTAFHDIALVIPAYLVYWLINELEGKIIGPAIVKYELNIPAGFILPFQLIATSAFGFLGLLLAVPILGILIILVDELYIRDTLGKTDRVPYVHEARDGTLRLVYPGEESEPETITPPDDAPSPARSAFPGAEAPGY